MSRLQLASNQQLRLCAASPIHDDVANGSEPHDLGPRANQSNPLDTGSAHFVSNCDPIDLALANALQGAVGAQQWGVVAQLAAELTARRVASSRPGVEPVTVRSEVRQR